MNEKHPNRKKDKHNPYTLMIVEGRYFNLCFVCGCRNRKRKYH
ncbi:Uncharacterised protein [Dorea longicatena]|uniref:Uncharacterized protein n=1 Tax=Dorea longicatena TaxID=88431 RepID=A0A564T1Y0_9FIRM|nr:Uncharacterised protein [Dorea longicatena]